VRGWREPGLHIHPAASSNFCAAEFVLGEGAVLSIAAGAVTERRPGALRIVLGDGAEVTVAERAWLRTEIERVQIIVGPGAKVHIGPDSLLNGCYLSAKKSITVGVHGFIGMGTRVFDADQHDFDTEHAERIDPVEIGDHAWVASDVTVLRGAQIGAHSVVGARSLVTGKIPSHTLAYGVPARLKGPVGDRSKVHH